MLLIDAMYVDELGFTGSAETSSFHALSDGNTEQPPIFGGTANADTGSGGSTMAVGVLAGGAGTCVGNWVGAAVGASVAGNLPILGSARPVDARPPAP